MKASSFLNRKSWAAWKVYLGIFLLVLISRLPYLLSDNFILNGDQSILGVISILTAKGKMLPHFFVGQQYGLISFEAIPTSILFAIFGPSDYLLVGVQLMLFSLGVFFLWKILYKWYQNHLFAWGFSLILILMPGLVYISLGAYPLYVSGFASVLFVLYLLECYRSDKKWIYTGIVLVLSYYIHPIWGIGLIPYLLYSARPLIKQRQVLLKTLVFSGTLAILLFLLSQLNADYWHPEPFQSLNIQHFSHIINALEHTFTGWYYLGSAYETPVWLKQGAVLYLIFFVISVFFSVFNVVMKKPGALKAIMFLLGTLLSAFLIGFIKIEDDSHMAYRYLAPSLLFSVVFICSVYRNTVNRYVSWGLVLPVSAFALSCYTYKDFHHYNKAGTGNDRQAILKLVKELEAQQIYTTYSTGPLVQWQIMFYSKMKVLSRFTDGKDRIPYIAKEVDKAFYSDYYMAVVGRYGYSNGMEKLPLWHQNITYIEKKYFYVLRPGKEMLEYGGYELNKPDVKKNR